MLETWVEGAGADEVPVLSHVFDHTAPEFDDRAHFCQRCHEFVPALERGERCPARVGQERGRLQ